MTINVEDGEFYCPDCDSQFDKTIQGYCPNCMNRNWIGIKELEEVEKKCS